MAAILDGEHKFSAAVFPGDAGAATVERRDSCSAQLLRDCGITRPNVSKALDGWLHGRMAVLRGVESGFTIVRAAKPGVLTVSDDRGRILAQQDGATVPFASLVATAPIRHDGTLYVRWGDWFAWLNAAGLVTLLFTRARKRDLAL